MLTTIGPERRRDIVALVRAAVSWRYESFRKRFTSGKAWNGIEKISAAGAIPRKLALVSEPDGALLIDPDCAPLPAMMAATCVPWANGSSSAAGVSPKIRPCKSGWALSTPLSLTATITLLPVKSKKFVGLDPLLASPMITRVVSVNSSRLW